MDYLVSVTNLVIHTHAYIVTLLYKQLQHFHTDIIYNHPGGMQSQNSSVKIPCLKV